MKKSLRILAVAAALFTMSVIVANAADQAAAPKATPAKTASVKTTHAKSGMAKTGGEKSMAAKSAMSTYLIVSPHTPEECLAALDATSSMGAADLSKWEWGCMSGDHTGYAMVQAASEEDALKMVPESVRAKAKATKMSKFSADQIKAMHEKK